MSRSGVAPRLAAASLLMVMLSSLSAAQPPRPPLDPIQETRDRQKVEDQKAESDVKIAIQDAERQAKTNPVKAARALKSMLESLDVSASISGETRKTLTAMLTDKIAVLEGRPVTPRESAAKTDPASGKIKLDKKTLVEDSATEVKAVNDGLREILKLKKENREREAERVIAGLGKAYPNNPAVISLQSKENFNTRVEDALEFSRQQDKRITLALNDVAKSSLPAIGDVEFPDREKWSRIKKRNQSIPLSEKEKKIIEALNKPVTVDWNNKMLEEALQEISTKIDQNLFIDKKSVTDITGQGFDLTKPVSLQAKGVSARTALRQMLSSVGMTFVVKDDAIQVMSIEKARDLLVTRVYYLGDLAQGIGPFGGPNAGPLVNMQNTLQAVELVMKAIQTSIDPMCWKTNGGPCTITFHYPSMSIIVRASAEVHNSLSSQFR